MGLTAPERLTWPRATERRESTGLTLRGELYPPLSAERSEYRREGRESLPFAC